MSDSSQNRVHEEAEDDSCDSDSADTVILKEEGDPEKGVSFVRFLSIDGGPTTDGDLAPNLPTKTASKPKLAALPTGLSFLQNHSQFFNTSMQPGSFLFTECRLQMAMDEQKLNQEAGSTSTLSSSLPTSSESSTSSPHNLVEIAPKPISATVVAPSTSPLPPPHPPVQIAPQATNSDSHFKNPKSVKLSDLRCKNREAARKCRAKKKNYIQQLEHDFKELKEKYAVIQQENDDLKRFIFQHFGVNLTPKGANNNSKAPIAVNSSALPVVLTVPGSTPAVNNTTGQSIILRLVQPSPVAPKDDNSAA